MLEPHEKRIKGSYTEGGVEAEALPVALAQIRGRQLPPLSSRRFGQSQFYEGLNRYYVGCGDVYERSRQLSRAPSWRSADAADLTRDIAGQYVQNHRNPSQMGDAASVLRVLCWLKRKATCRVQQA